MLLDEEWFNRLNQALAGASTQDDLSQGPIYEVELVVSGTKAGKLATRWRLDNGVLESVRIAKPDEQPTALRIPVKLVEFEQLLSGELDPAVAFMQGDLKPEGPTGDFLAFLAALQQPNSKAALAAIG